MGYYGGKDQYFEDGKDGEVRSMVTIRRASRGVRS